MNQGVSLLKELIDIMTVNMHVHWQMERPISWSQSVWTKSPFPNSNHPLRICPPS